MDTPQSLETAPPGCGHDDFAHDPTASLTMDTPQFLETAPPGCGHDDFAHDPTASLRWTLPQPLRLPLWVGSMFSPTTQPRPSLDAPPRYRQLICLRVFRQLRAAPLPAAAPPHPIPICTLLGLIPTPLRNPLACPYAPTPADPLTKISQTPSSVSMLASLSMEALRNPFPDVGGSHAGREGYSARLHHAPLLTFHSSERVPS